MKVTKEGKALIREHQRRTNPTLWDEVCRDWREMLAWVGVGWIILASLLWLIIELLIPIIL